MQEHGGEIRGDEIHHLFALAAEVGEKLGAPVKQTHEHRKAHVSGHGKHRTRERHGQAEVHDILYILKRGKAQRDGDGVNYPVKAVIEIRVFPCLELHQQELRSLLDDRNDCERENNFIIFVVLTYLIVEYLRADYFEHYGHQSRDNAHEYQGQKQSGRFFFDRVVLIDIAQQEYRGQNGREDIYGEYRRCRQNKKHLISSHMS